MNVNTSHPPNVPMPECNAATPREELERQIMDSTLPKNEREWWARREIEGLRAIINPDLSALRWRGECGHEWRKDQADDCPICECDRLKAKVEYLESELPPEYRAPSSAISTGK